MTEKCFLKLCWKCSKKREKWWLQIMAKVTWYPYLESRWAELNSGILLLHSPAPNSRSIIVNHCQPIECNNQKLATLITQSQMGPLNLMSIGCDFPIYCQFFFLWLTIKLETYWLCSSPFSILRFEILSNFRLFWRSCF